MRCATSVSRSMQSTIEDRAHRGVSTTALLSRRVGYLGHPDTPLIVIPHPWKILSPEEVKILGERIADQVIERLRLPETA